METPVVRGARIFARHLKELNPSLEKSPDCSSSSVEKPLSYSSCSRSVILERARSVATVIFLVYACIATAPELSRAMAISEPARMAMATIASSSVNPRSAFMATAPPARGPPRWSSR